MSHRHRSNSLRARGFTLVEAVMSMLVVSLVIGAAMTVSASTVRARNADAERATAITLADALLDEIRGKAYREPGAAPERLGLDAGETLDSRTTLDDIDDYDGLTEDSAATEDGAKIPGLRYWTRSASVTWVKLTDPTSDAAAATGVKRVQVTVAHQGRVLASRSTLRSVAE